MSKKLLIFFFIFSFGVTQVSLGSDASNAEYHLDNANLASKTTCHKNEAIQIDAHNHFQDKSTKGNNIPLSECINHDHGLHHIPLGHFISFELENKLQWIIRNTFPLRLDKTNSYIIKVLRPPIS